MKYDIISFITILLIIWLVAVALVTTPAIFGWLFG